MILRPKKCNMLKYKIKYEWTLQHVAPLSQVLVTLVTTAERTWVQGLGGD